MGIETRNFELVTVNPHTGGTVLLDSESHRLFMISDALRDRLRGDEPVWPAEAEAELERLRAAGVLAPYNARALSAADPLDFVWPGDGNLFVHSVDLWNDHLRGLRQDPRCALGKNTGTFRFCA